MSDPSTLPQASKQPDSPQKREVRSAGASSIREDVFHSLPEYPDDKALENSSDDSDEKAIPWLQVVLEKTRKTRRKSMDLLKLGKKEGDSKKDDSSDRASKTRRKVPQNPHIHKLQPLTNPPPTLLKPQPPNILIPIRSNPRLAKRRHKHDDASPPVVASALHHVVDVDAERGEDAGERG
ncbi:hypothetical protein OPT61_g943 [Boeremia exigua]|uniref:Uncharacterized protein n=1 Tax=Boeremia exigua TaxID=749465 RepID=A0ACC2ISE6_9PLEO|nr:hypothetical protein OPT61_g943 [Boeremia exigua]